MNIISVMTFGISLLIVSKDVTASEIDSKKQQDITSGADFLDSVRENQGTILERLRKLEESDSKKQQDIKSLQDRESIKQLEIESLNLQIRELKDGSARKNQQIATNTKSSQNCFET